MSQVEVIKLTQHVAIGAAEDSATVSKFLMHVLLVPGDDTGSVEPSQAHVYGQTISRG